jgi:hypothetical protein
MDFAGGRAAVRSAIRLRFSAPNVESGDIL